MGQHVWIYPIYIFNNFIPDSQGFPSKSGPPDHEIGEDGDPYDAHQEGNRVVSLPVLVLGVRDAAPHGDHQGQGEGPHDLSHDGVAGPATDVVHVRLLSFLLGALLLLNLQRLLRLVFFPVLSVESITILGLDGLSVTLMKFCVFKVVLKIIISCLPAAGS